MPNVKCEMPNTTNLATNASLNAKLNEVKGEIPNITNLATSKALTAVENEIPNVTNLVKKTDYNTKNNEIEKKITDYNQDKYITTQVLRQTLQFTVLQVTASFCFKIKTGKFREQK